MKLTCARSSPLLSVITALLVAGAAFAEDAGPGDAGTDGGTLDPRDAGTGDGGEVDPPRWTCDAERYEDGEVCDCGCGVPDPDCPTETTVFDCGFSGCPEGETVLIDDLAACSEPICGDGTNAGAFLQTAPETCDDGNTTDGDGCSATCQVEQGYGCPVLGGPCTALPDAWACPPRYYGSDDGCDCGCGALDADCPAGAVEADCEYAWCDDDLEVSPGELTPDDVTQCAEQVPPPDAGAEPGPDAGPEPGDDAGIPDVDDGDGCSACTVTGTGAPLSLAALALLGGLGIRRRRR